MSLSLEAATENPGRPPQRGSGSGEVTGERCRPATPVDEGPSLGHGHRVSVSATHVVMSGMCFLGQRVEEDGLVGVVVVERGGCRRATSGSGARTSHELTISLDPVHFVDRGPVASPPWPRRRTTPTIPRSRIVPHLRRARMDRPEALASRRDGFRLPRRHPDDPGACSGRGPRRSPPQRDLRR